MKLAIVGNQPVCCVGLKMVVSGLTGISEVEILSGDNLIDVMQKIRLYDPEMLILAWEKEVVDIIFGFGHKMPILVLTQCNPRLQRPFLRVGCSLISSDADAAAIKDAVRSMQNGKVYITRDTLLSLNGKQKRGDKGSKLEALSSRKKDIVDLVVQGNRNKEIGAKLGISDRTVKNHLYEIFEKVGVRSRIELAELHNRENLLDVPIIQ
jgi:DNA-binding NarL/FixJ family response regulator